MPKKSLSYLSCFVDELGTLDMFQDPMLTTITIPRNLNKLFMVVLNF